MGLSRCRCVSRQTPALAMFLRTALLLLVVCILVAEGQNNRRQNRRQNRRPNNRQNNRNNRGQFGRNGVTRNGARDARGTEVYPGCSGKVCLPEAQLCAERKEKAGHKQIGGKSYWVSWDSDEAVLKNARWNWFTARNYCRKRCMDLVAFENGNEQNAVGEFMNAGNVREVWTSGRLCDKEVDGCEQTGSSLTTSGDGSGPQASSPWERRTCSKGASSTGGHQQ